MILREKERKKVLFLVTSFVRFKGDESAWFDYLRLCAREGVDYDVIAPHDREGSGGFDEIDGVRIRRFQYFFPKGLQRIAYHGGMAHNIANSIAAKAQLPFFMLSFFLKAMGHAGGKQLVHAMFLPSELVAVAIKKLTGKPFVVWVQRMVPGNGIGRWLHGIVLRNCDFVFFNSAYTRGEALKVCEPKRYGILHMGVDMRLFRPMPKSEMRPKLGLPKDAKKDLPIWINAADIFAVPSIVDANRETETLGIVAIEGIACGRPVIASSVGGLPDVVKDGVSGFLVQQKSPGQIAEKIDLLFGKSGLIEKIGKSARAFAEENFSERQAVEKTIRVYDEILGK
ncbi:MAG: glycosyltransferase family 4 protein [Candidatus Diapherotrites archaeon]|nr:glycosyltransferase family 4 protein [Candidatus Diapherotrites archaeon]